MNKSDFLDAMLDSCPDAITRDSNPLRDLARTTISALRELEGLLEDAQAEVESSIHWEYNNAVLRGENELLHESNKEAAETIDLLRKQQES